MSQEITITPEIVEVAQEIFSEFVKLKPERSLSFSLTAEGVEAISEAKKLADWGIGGNKPKLKETALENLESLEDSEPGEPLNVNFTEYEIKAMEEVLSVIERALEKHKDGVLSK
jgi:hypothetical protein